MYDYVFITADIDKKIFKTLISLKDLSEKYLFTYSPTKIYSLALICRKDLSKRSSEDSLSNIEDNEKSELMSSSSEQIFKNDDMIWIDLSKEPEEIYIYGGELVVKRDDCRFLLLKTEEGHKIIDLYGIHREEIKKSVSKKKKRSKKKRKVKKKKNM
jgi:hypothetical protein